MSGAAGKGRQAGAIVPLMEALQARKESGAVGGSWWEGHEASEKAAWRGTPSWAFAGRVRWSGAPGFGYPGQEGKPRETQVRAFGLETEIGSLGKGRPARLRTWSLRTRQEERWHLPGPREGGVELVGHRTACELAASELECGRR